MPDPEKKVQVRIQNYSTMCKSNLFLIVVAKIYCGNFIRSIPVQWRVESRPGFFWIRIQSSWVLHIGILVRSGFGSGFRIPIKFEDLKSGSGFLESRIKIRFFLDPDPVNQDPTNKKNWQDFLDFLYLEVPRSLGSLQHPRILWYLELFFFFF